MSKKGKIIMWVVIAVVAIAVVAIILSTTLNTGTSIDFATFKTYVDNYGKVADVSYSDGKVVADDSGNVTVYVLDEDGNYVLEDGVKTTTTVSAKEVIYSVTVDNYNFTGYSVYGTTYKSTGPSMYSYNDLVDSWIDYGITISYEDPNSGSYWSSILSVLMIVVVCVIFWLIIRSAAGGGTKGNSFARSKARISTNIKVRFTDVAGAEEEKLELAEVVEFLKQPKKFSDLGARIPKGVLLVGPPGTGKTLFAKAVAGEAGVPFFSVSGSDFVEMYVGVGASRVRDLFDMAKKNQPCIIFIDEIDAVGRQRGAGLGGGNDEREQTLNQILVQMDGFESNEGVIVMAATNRSDILDPALMRPGRFDRQIFVNLPDVKGREQILKVHSRNKPLAPDVNFKTIARITSGFSGADLANLLNEAAILAARANKKFIGNIELYEGVNKVLMGPQKKSHVITESDKRITAYHEAGHAIVARMCKHCDPVQEVSIIPRGNAAGYTMTRPDSDDSHVSREKLKDFICMALGGRVAEELVIKDITTGASNDLERVTEIAKKMVTEWGMSDKLGLVTYGSNSQTVFLGKDMETHNAYSEQTAKIIDEEMHSIVNDAHARATGYLTEKRSVLDNMARVLIERETIYTEEVDMLMEGKSYTEVIAFMDEQDSAHMENPFKRYGE
ncbi:MAG: ATP-dependent zinc metalloprotease FtsH [Clostridia bacterium]|nr:ATP-dependent zinc metalloprotease FtsH [Clostridia bacterium]